MPLIVPSLPTGESGTSLTPELDAWRTRLLGKTLTDGPSDGMTDFSKKDLPTDHRIVEHGSVASAEHQADRLSVFLGEDGIVRKLEYQ